MEAKRNRSSLLVIIFMALTAIIIAGCSEDSTLPTEPVAPIVSAFGRMPETPDMANFTADGHGVTIGSPFWIDNNQPEYILGVCLKNKMY